MVSLRTFFCGWNMIIYILGVKRHSRATKALRLIDTHSVVIWIWEKKKENSPFRIGFLHIVASNSRVSKPDALLCFHTRYIS